VIVILASLGSKFHEQKDVIYRPINRFEKQWKVQL